MKEQHAEHKDKYVMSDAAILGLVAIISIFLIVYIAIHSTSISGNDNAGQASKAVLESQSRTILCNILVSQTNAYDNTVMAVSLGAGESTYYRGYTVSVQAINDQGCILDVNGNNDYIALGQIEKLGQVYITVKDITG